MALENLTAFDGLRPEDFADYTREQLLVEIQNPTRLGERILPTRTVDEYELDAGELSFRPVKASNVAPGTTFPTGPLGTFTKRLYQITKQGFWFGLEEGDLLDHRQFFINDRNTNLSAEEIMRTPLANTLYSYADMLREAYLNQNEYMRWQALALDHLTVYKGRSALVNVNWGIPATHKFDVSASATQRWDAFDTADGIADLQHMSRTARDENGTPGVVFVMSEEMLDNLLRQASTRKRLAEAGFLGLAGQLDPAAAAGQESTSDTLTATSIERLLNRNARQTGARARIELYDKTYDHWTGEEGGEPETRRYLPVNRVVMLSAEPLNAPGLPNPVSEGTAVGARNNNSGIGYLADGPVVENDFNPGVHIWAMYNKYPIQVQMAMAAWTFPILNHRRVFQLKTVPDAA